MKMVMIRCDVHIWAMRLYGYINLFSDVLSNTQSASISFDAISLEVLMGYFRQKVINSRLDLIHQLMVNSASSLPKDHHGTKSTVCCASKEGYTEIVEEVPRSRVLPSGLYSGESKV